MYCARHLAFHFLLSGDAKSPLKSDRAVRVSVKNLALNCLVHVGILEPQIWNLHLSKSPSKGIKNLSPFSYLDYDYWYPSLSQIKEIDCTRMNNSCSLCSFSYCIT